MAEKAAIKAADKDGNLRYLYQIFYSYFSFCPLGRPINKSWDKAITVFRFANTI